MRLVDGSVQRQPMNRQASGVQLWMRSSWSNDTVWYSGRLQNVRRHSPVATFHSFSVLSEDPDSS